MFILQWYPIEYQYVNQELAIGYGRERVTDFVHSSFGERGDSLVKQRGVKHGETVECRHAIDVHPIGNGERNTLRNPPNCPGYRRHNNGAQYGDHFGSSNDQIGPPPGWTGCPKNVALLNVRERKLRLVGFHHGSAAIDASEAARTHAVSSAVCGRFTYSATS